MRKYIIGALFGAALMFAFSAYAEEVKTVIGKAIQGEFPVKIDGKELEKKAIVVDGSSYLPVRAFGEATGYDVKFDPEGEVLLTKIAEEPEVETPPAPTGPSERQKLIMQQDDLTQEIISLGDELYSLSRTPDMTVEIENQIKAIEQKIQDDKAKIQELQKQIDKMN